MAHHGVSAVEVSKNDKIGLASATYVSQRSCDPSCPLLENGCYAEVGQTQWSTNRVNRQAEQEQLTPEQLAHAEAISIHSLTGWLPLRLHVVGDCRTNRIAKIVSTAARAYSVKHGQVVWSYTHAWRKVNRASWQNVSILASCESIKQTRQAMAKGYAAAIVLPEQHTSAKAYMIDDVRVVPCPQQTGRSENCRSCKLCFHADRLLATRTVIAFQPDTNTTKKVHAALTQITNAA